MSRVFSPLRQLRPPAAAAAAATGRRRRSRGLAQGVLRLERRPDLCGHPELQLRLQQPVQNSNAARQLVQSTQAGQALPAGPCMVCCQRSEARRTVTVTAPDSSASIISPRSTGT